MSGWESSYQIHGNGGSSLANDDRSERVQRTSTGVPGLDTLLCGGMIRGTVHIVRGPPGAGKTVLANQMCFHFAGRGERCLYLTVLAESHDRLILQLRGFEFFDPSKVPEAIYYESAHNTLDTEGAQALLRMIINEQKQRGGSLLVLDGLFAVAEHLGSEREFRAFINELTAIAHLGGVTVLLLTNSERGSDHPEFTTVDGWIDLGVRQREYRTFRDLQVHKYRVSDFIPGRHMLLLDDRGIRILPRLETCEGSRVTPRELPPPRLRTGIADLDDMLHGGLTERSTTLVVGPTGIGKTSFALHFMASCSADQPGLFFGFYETADDLRGKAAMLGMDAQNLVAGGAVQVVWHPPTENLLDELGYEILTTVRRRGVRRLCIDGLEGLAQSAIYPERIGRFLAALTNALRAEGATTLFTLEVPELVGGESHVEFTPIAATAQNVVLLRYAELGSMTRRTVAIVKLRESAFDPAVREFEIGPQGISIGGVPGQSGESAHGERG